MTSTLLIAREIDKSFAGVHAVQNVSFELPRGEIFALLGPNGAGKTTMVRMLMGIIRPDRGSIQFTLARTQDGRHGTSQLGYLPEERGLYLEVPVLRTLVYFGILRGMDRKAATAAAESWLDRLDLLDRSKDKLDTLSKGNQQKVQFIASIIHRPEFAVLDEPFSGLDPVNQDLFLGVIRELRNQGMTILLSAHQMQLVERIADRILLISQGREILSGTLAEVQGTSAESKLLVTVKKASNLAKVESHPAVQKVMQTSDTELTIFVQKEESLSDLLVTLGSSLEIASVQSDRVSLHDIYVDAVGARTPGSKVDEAPCPSESSANGPQELSP